MNAAVQQKALSADQIQAFHHDVFVEDQLRDFAELVPRLQNEGVVVDVGGGCGFFARGLSDRHARRTRVIDMDPASIEMCRAIKVEAVVGDALAPEPAGDEEVACFNLILHHLIGPTEKATRSLQGTALQAWRGHVPALFVNEYIYQSYVGNLSGRLIYAITSSKILSAIGLLIARVVPSFRANTFGVGVRFRSHGEWLRLFEEAGYRVAEVRIGDPEPVALPLRLLFIKTIRRDSFRLEPTG